MRILVIEDEARIQAFLARGLEAEGYTVVAAGDGREGIELARRTHWDLVVLDLLLPGLNGLQVLQELHRTKPELPVVILSARSDVQTKLRGFELGASDYLAKPFSLDELLARIRVRCAARRRSATSTCCAAVSVVLDVARRQAGSATGRRTSPTASSGSSTTCSCMRARSSAGSGCSRRCGATTSTRARTSSRSACAGCVRSSGPRLRSKRYGMRATAWLRSNPLEAGVGGVRRRELGGDGRLAELGDDPVPLRLDQSHDRLRHSDLVDADDVGRSLGRDPRDRREHLLRRVRGIQLWGELFEVPLMSAMFLAMVWHAQRRQAALAEVQGVAEMRASLLERQERFLHDASHELRTPVTIARGHLELLRRSSPTRPSSRSRSTSWAG